MHFCGSGTDSNSRYIVERFLDQVTSSTESRCLWLDFASRLTSFPILLAISFYERQSKRAGTITFYDTVTERVFETLPRSLKRLCELVFISTIKPNSQHRSSAIFEGLAGADADIDAVCDIRAQLQEC